MPSTFEQYIGNLLRDAAVTITSTLSDRARVDYTYSDHSGDRIAMEVKGNSFQPDEKHLTQLMAAIKPIIDHIDKFLLITPFQPTIDDLKRFTDASEGAGVATEWLSGDQLAGTLGLADCQFPRRYRSRPEETHSFHDLDRQLSQALVRQLQTSLEPVETFLRVGERVPVVVVLSDLKSFSLLVKATKPDDLNEAMSKYYRLVRDLVWAHGGVLDKFIGDAVLAIFGYPTAFSGAPLNAVRFAADLIEVGKPILEGIRDVINESIDTGTRVGISTGEISVLNIGVQRIELSFVGDVINLAARLEHSSDVDGCLIDNLTKVSISNSDQAFLQRLSLQSRRLEPESVKGQLTTIQSWQIPAAAIPTISNLERMFD